MLHKSSGKQGHAIATDTPQQTGTSYPWDLTDLLNLYIILSWHCEGDPRLNKGAQEPLVWLFGLIDVTQAFIVQLIDKPPYVQLEEFVSISNVSTNELIGQVVSFLNASPTVCRLLVCPKGLIAWYESNSFHFCLTSPNVYFLSGTLLASQSLLTISSSLKDGVTTAWLRTWQYCNKSSKPYLHKVHLEAPLTVLNTEFSATCQSFILWLKVNKGYMSFLFTKWTW